jgi:hypothetical protein
MLSSLFSSFTIHADAPAAKEQPEEGKEEEKEEGGEEEAEPEAEAEEEEEAEPEDVCFSVSRRVKECN